jgi:hypothetical protein
VYAAETAARYYHIRTVPLCHAARDWGLCPPSSRIRAAPLPSHGTGLLQTINSSNTLVLEVPRLQLTYQATGNLLLFDTAWDSFANSTLTAKLKATVRLRVLDGFVLDGELKGGEGSK